MRKLVKAASLLTFVSIGEMIFRFVRTKAIAIFLGLSGTGFLAQLANFFEILRMAGSMGTRRAVIKQIAENKEGVGSPRYRDILYNSFFLVIFTSCFLSFLVTLFSRNIAEALYGNSDPYLYVIAVGWILPVASAATLTSSILKANLQYASFAKYTLGSYILAICLSPFFIYFWGYAGTVVVQGLFFAMPMLAYLVLNARKQFLFFSNRVHWPVMKEQLLDGFNFVYGETLNMLVRLVVAAWITRELGLAQMGIYQVVVTFSTVYLTIPVQSVSGYTLTAIAAATTPAEISKAVNDTTRFLLFLLMPVLACLMAWPELFIDILYSPKFFPAVPLLRIQLPGVFVGLLLHALGSVLVAKGKLKFLYIGSTFSAVFKFVSALILFSHWQLTGVAVAYAVTPIAVGIFLYLIVRRQFALRIESRNKKLVVFSALWMLLAWILGALMEGWLWKLAAIGAGVIWFRACSTLKEREFLFKKARNLFTKPNRGAKV